MAISYQATSGLNSAVIGNSEYRRLIYALLAGVVVTLGLPPFPWTGILVPLGLAWFFAQLPGADKPAKIAWAFGMAHQMSLLHWLFLLVPAKTIPTRALVPAQALAAIGYVALFYLVFGWLFGRARGRLGTEKAFLLLPVLYAGMEMLRDRGELAYPWCLSGSAVIGTPLLALARTFGEAGVSTAMAFTAAALACLAWSSAGWRILSRTALFLWLAVALGSLVGGNERVTDLVPVAAVQANVSLEEKWDPAQLDASVDPYTELTIAAADAGAELVVWAETAVPAYLRYDRDLMNWVRDLTREKEIWLFTGFPDADRDSAGTMEKFNSSGLFNPRGTLTARYAKHHLLPIGEAMPFTRFFPFLKGIDVGQAEWTPGAPPEVMEVLVGEAQLNFSTLICFESILGRMARQSVRGGSQCLVVLTNDGWFGQTAGPRQHAALALMRSAECGVPLVRCANNGISLICDSRGQTVDQLGLGRKGLVQATVAAGSGGTLFVRFGTVPLICLLFLWTVWVLFLPGREGRGDPTPGR